MTLARFASPDRDRAYRIIAMALGCEPPLTRPMRSYPIPACIDAMCMLEIAFQIGIEVDETYDAPDLSAFLDLIEAKIAALAAGAQPRTPCAIYDFAAYRAALKPREAR